MTLLHSHVQHVRPYTRALRSAAVNAILAVLFLVLLVGVASVVAG